MRNVLLIALMLLAVSGFAQKFEYDVLFHGIGDNREFFSGKAESQTILGERTSFAIGTTLDEKHQFRIGLSHLYEFGSELDDQKPKLTAYYHYEDKQKEFYFGAFPRLGLIDFPLALITDTFLYYRPNIEGLYGKYSWDWGHQAGFVDWTSRQTESKRETFMAGFSGEMGTDYIFFQNYITMFHYAGTANRVEGEHIHDNLGTALFLGTNLDQFLPLSNAYFRLGWMHSKFKIRTVMDDFETANSMLGEFYGELKSFALRSTLHMGEGHHVTNGDRFYDVDNYWRTDVIWRFLSSKHVEGRFNLSFHLVEGDLDQSQQLSLIYRFGS
ncbi:hypothetical protein [Sunxiuqinia elliptica]|uniref:Porin n=1 Tax=Sunxiuqinia elliptica TaxID=655355 RepID=A0A4R6GKT2_9BACT|nr:hypothetical protein [Sunxiuqinia elliptica]TDN95739.1 hypothetical protein DET52_11460 [Sunxiuqinia elliptica]TDO66934.1 hypothetical protein DET65_0518 [Sunxiuqinia elliptica]